MSDISSQSDQEVKADTEAKAAPVEHSLLKKSGPDDMLLTIYQKVEKKLAGQLKSGLSKVIGCPVGMELTESKKIDFNEWLDGQEQDSVYLQYQFGISDTPLWVRINRLFLTACVDCFFGGEFDGQSSATGKLNRSEVAMIERVAGVIGVSLTQGWSAIFETTLRYTGYIHDKDDVETTLEDSNVLIAAVGAEISDQNIEAVDIVQTLDGLAAIEPQLNRTDSKEVAEIDPIWRHALKDSVEEVYLPVRSVLGRPTMQLSQLSRLEVGDILPVAPTDNVPLIVGDRVFAQGSIGEQNGGVAFQIKQFL